MSEKVVSALEEILDEVRREVEPLLKWTVRQDPGFSFDAMEQRVLVATRRIGCSVLGRMAELDRGRMGKRLPGNKGTTLLFKGCAPRNLVTLLGPVRYRRAYYHDAETGESRWPADERMGLLPRDEWSPGVQRTKAKMDLRLPYEEASVVIQELVGLDLSYEEGQRLVGEMGEFAAAQVTELASSLIDRHEDLPSPPPKVSCDVRAIVCADGTTVEMRHPRGTDREFREIKVGTAYLASRPEGPPAVAAGAPPPKLRLAVNRVEPEEGPEVTPVQNRARRRRHQLHPDEHDLKLAILRDASRGGCEMIEGTQRYVATMEGSRALGRALYVKATQLGITEDTPGAYLGDGSPWVGSEHETHFPGLVPILDIWHLFDKVAITSRALWGRRTQEACTWAKEQMWSFLNGRIDEVLERLDRLREKDWQGNQREAIGTLARYVKDNRDRMDYPRYIALGLPIGSGVVEASCKHLVGARMKRSGMHWIKAGASALGVLRAALLSNEFDALWVAYWSHRTEERQAA